MTRTSLSRDSLLRAARSPAVLIAAGLTAVLIAALIRARRDREDDEVRRQPVDVWREGLGAGLDREEPAERAGAGCPVER